MSEHKVIGLHGNAGRQEPYDIRQTYSSDAREVKLPRRAYAFMVRATKRPHDEGSIRNPHRFRGMIDLGRTARIQKLCDPLTGRLD
jgi:hypothetical protein